MTMFMPLLYNIEQFNNTVAIQCLVQMYTQNEYSVLLVSVSPACGRS